MQAQFSSTSIWTFVTYNMSAAQLFIHCTVYHYPALIDWLTGGISYTIILLEACAPVCSFHPSRILFPHPISIGKSLLIPSLKVGIADSLHQNKLTNPGTSTTQYATQLSYVAIINTQTRPINHNGYFRHDQDLPL